MFNPDAKVETTADKTKQLFDGLESLTNVDVLVGIPSENDNREENEIDEIGNAELAYIHTHGIRSRPMIQEMDKEIKKGADYNKAYEMYIHEHGSPLWAVPPRPIIEPAIEDPDNKATITPELKKAAQDALDGNIKAMEEDLERAGIQGQNVVRDWFTNPKNNWEPNAPLTIKAKGSENPLIDTGELRKSITYVVKKD